MFENIIEFSAEAGYIKKEKEVFPIPASQNIPDWFKKLKHKHDHPTIKGCIPFLDTLTAGYILKLPQDYHITCNNKVERINEKGEKEIIRDDGQRFPFDDRLTTVNLNRGSNWEVQKKYQIEGSPIIKKNNNMKFILKIINPWYIKPPPGYSCLFVPPLNNEKEDRFHIMPGIVDTDSYEIPINFPFVINGDKYKSLNDVIPKGTPYVQVIPFKRNNWKMKIKSKNEEDAKWSIGMWRTRFIHNYKIKTWSKKSWK